MTDTKSTGPVFRFSLPPLGLALPLDAFEAWLAAAAPGESIVYASGAALPRTAPTVVRARALAPLRLDLAQRRSATGWEFIAQMRAPVAPAVAAPPKLDTDVTGAVLRIVTRAANFGLACPTNAEIAAAVGLRDPDAASYRLRKLVAAGVISIEDFGPRQRRIVRIAATGKRTVAGAL